MNTKLVGDIVLVLVAGIEGASAATQRQLPVAKVKEILKQITQGHSPRFNYLDSDPVDGEVTLPELKNKRGNNSIETINAVYNVAVKQAADSTKFKMNDWTSMSLPN